MIHQYFWCDVLREILGGNGADQKDITQKGDFRQASHANKNTVENYFNNLFMLLLIQETISVGTVSLLGIIKKSNLVRQTSPRTVLCSQSGLVAASRYGTQIPMHSKQIYSTLPEMLK